MQRFFLESTPKEYHTIFLLLCLTFFSQYDYLVHPCCYRWHYFMLFDGLVIFHCMYVLHLLYPILCQWTFRVLPCLGCCKEYCNEKWVFKNKTLPILDLEILCKTVMLRCSHEGRVWRVTEKWTWVPALLGN